MYKEYEYCKRCGKRLKTLENRLIGYGPVCYKKSRENPVNKRLFSTQKFVLDKAK